MDTRCLIIQLQYCITACYLTLANDLLFIRMETSACKSSRFKEPVSDALEEEKRTNAVPDKTKAATAWGIGIYTEWAAHRAWKTSSVSGVRDPLHC